MLHAVSTEIGTVSISTVSAVEVAATSRLYIVDNGTSNYQITDSAPYITESQKPRRKVICQDRLLARIKSCASLSLGEIEHSNFAGCLETSHCQLQELINDNPDLHDDPTPDGHPRFDRDIVAVLIFCLHHIEYREN